MKLTKEQQAILDSTGNIKINAVAGSGKTTTIIEYAKTRPRSSKILYLAFNKTVKKEAEAKFKNAKLTNASVKTAHGLAYGYIIPSFGYSINPFGYKTYEVVELLNIKGDKQKHTQYIIANHVLKFLAYFCNSTVDKVQDLNYLDIINDKKTKSFVKGQYKKIQHFTRLFLAKMNNHDTKVTHDFYLKKFQLECPKLPFDYILFDEGQDASPAMLDVFQKQKATKVIVGDTHQQIYGWRHAVNSLEQVDFPSYELTNSFRFRQDIADLSKEILGLKNILQPIPTVRIFGKGRSKEEKTQAVLGRTNLGLLLKAIQLAIEGGGVNSIYFEGNINSYTFADEGTSLYDILNLYLNQHHLIRDKLIKRMGNVQELEDYIEKTEEVQLKIMLEIVKKYERQIPNILKELKAKHVSAQEKHLADIIFSTVHRCKGMEYDVVHLVDDFISEEKLLELVSESKAILELDKLNEEINLLYVAITRTKNILHIPEALLPVNANISKRINIIRPPAPLESDTLDELEELEAEFLTEAIDYDWHRSKKENANAGKPWTKADDDELTLQDCNQKTIFQMASFFDRSTGAIRARIKKLELHEIYG